ncbi:HAD family hydrolase [Halarcobacter sp.]|uniref:HAD family hydrolase n=1 Tax=Halarcobacter sp. TaxID=2321133 RepID=UPI002AA5E884|nr:HAD family hydrolase [Halarcobacter sp.]
MSNKIAFFDFDGTITTDDSLLKFIKFAVGNKKFLFGLIILSPMLILYKLKIIPNYKAKQYFISWYFKGMKKDKFYEISYEYSLNHLNQIIRPKAIERIDWHKKNNDKIVIVSASIDCWIQPWCEKNNLELISTKLDFKGDKVTGKFLTKNCYGQEKVNRIKEIYNLTEFDFIYAYGDSSGDKEMLDIANEKFYKPFR